MTLQSLQTSSSSLSTSQQQEQQPQQQHNSCDINHINNNDDNDDKGCCYLSSNEIVNIISNKNVDDRTKNDNDNNNDMKIVQSNGNSIYNQQEQQEEKQQQQQQQSSLEDTTCIDDKENTTGNNNSNNNGIDNTTTTTTNDSIVTISNSQIPIISNDINIIYKNITKHVIICKLKKYRHLLVKNLINNKYLEYLFPYMLQYYNPQQVIYNGGIASITQWKISCYLEVINNCIPITNPNIQLLSLFQPLLNTCNTLFLHWYQQQHSCNNSTSTSTSKTTKTQVTSCHRLMTFITRYTPNPGEQSLLKHIDGAGKVNGSVVIALPIDKWSSSEQDNTFIGGGLTFWDGRRTTSTCRDSTTSTIHDEIHYDTRSGDVAFIDRAVWHQADPITKGTRWALVIFYKVS